MYVLVCICYVCVCMCFYVYVCMCFYVCMYHICIIYIYTWLWINLHCPNPMYASRPEPSPRGVWTPLLVVPHTTSQGPRLIYLYGRTPLVRFSIRNWTSLLYPIFHDPYPIIIIIIKKEGMFDVSTFAVLLAHRDALPWKTLYISINIIGIGGSCLTKFTWP